MVRNFGPYPMVSGSNLAILNKLVLEYQMKESTAYADLPKLSVYGSYIDTTEVTMLEDYVLGYESTAIDMAKVVKPEYSSVFSIRITIENFEKFQRFRGISRVISHTKQLPVRKNKKGV